MKNILLNGFLFISITAQAQNVLRVNNTAGVNAPYTTIDGAIAAASAGDIILVEGSTSPYPLPNGYTITKLVHIKGPGYFLDQNLNLQATANHALISLTSVLAFAAGSEGSSIQGMTIEQQPIEVRVSNISISHNRLMRVDIRNTSSCSNLNIQRNILGAFATFGAGVVGYYGSAVYNNINISNNLCFWTINLSANCFGLFANNYVEIGLSGNRFSNMGNLNVVNSIFNTFADNTITFLSPTIQNNVFCGSGYYPVFSPALNNLINQDINAIYTGTGSSDGVYALKPLSPAIGAGIGGTDCGIYGGSSPYKPSGIATGQHTIHNLIVPATVIQNGTLNVKVSAKVN
jgi:hypothetical protein